MSLQEIIVIAVVFFCISYAGVHIVRFFQNAQKGQDPCSSCTSDCALRNQLEKKKQECRRNHQKTKKNCCG